MVQVSQFITCPLCKKADDIRKVSTIVAQGMPTYGRTSYGITAGNLLINYLQPPPPPHPRPTTSLFWSFTLVIIFLICIWCVIGFIGFGILIGLADGLNTLSSLLINLVDTLPIQSILQIFLGMEILALLILLRHASQGAVRKAKQAALQRENNERKNRWRLAIDRWNSMYYCYRDDIVFLPGHSQKPVPPASMRMLL